MGTLTLLVFLLLLAKRATEPAAPAPAPSVPSPLPTAVPAPPASTAVPASYSAPPWPQAVPAGLPAFPGPGWTPAEPPGAAVVSRAWALLKQLWQYGPGTHKTEQTAGRWITYLATPMGAKKGVTAWRLRDESSSSSSSSSSPDSFQA